MYREAAQSGACVLRQQTEAGGVFQELGEHLRRHPPAAIITCARGSSDHAATYGKYVLEAYTGIPVASAAPSLSSMYGVAPHVRNCLYIAVSQSGRSPDLLTSVEAARAGGAFVVSFCNDPSAPLNALADIAVPLCAGPEISVAATKSYLTSLAAFLRLTACWTQRADLMSAGDRLGDALEQSFRLDWSPALDVLGSAHHLYVIGRGPGLAAAQEVALKCKETSGLHAEAFSGAEVRHGPYALLQPDFPALVLGQNDVTRPGLAALVTDLAQRAVPVLHAGVGASAGTALPMADEHAAVQPALHVSAAYGMLAALAVHRGFDPDTPPHLRKVTETH
jgi:glucosamine--fructose-6-phosphate aminotransferase (isomerizing)